MTLRLQEDEDSLKKAAALLKRGELVAFPTETVYGLGAPVFAPSTIAKIFAVKNRPQDNPLIAHIASLEELSLLGEVSKEALLLATHFFPGPLTLVLKKRKCVPSIVSGGGETVAVRMPNHLTALKLISLVGEPLVAPSANLSGKPSSTHSSHVLNDFEGKIGAVIEGGATSIGIESTVLSLVGEPLLLRPGSLPKAAIETVLKHSIRAARTGETGGSPGMKYRHYAPKAPVFLFSSHKELKEHEKRVGMRKRKVGVPQEATLYSFLREADKEGAEEICLVCQELLSEGLINRLDKIVSN